MGVDEKGDFLCDSKYEGKNKVTGSLTGFYRLISIIGLPVTLFFPSYRSEVILRDCTGCMKLGHDVRHASHAVRDVREGFGDGSDPVQVVDRKDTFEQVEDVEYWWMK